MLFKLSFRNITRSIKDYAIYFFTLVLGVTLFYVFNSVGSQAAVLELNNSRKLIVDLLAKILSGMSVLVVFILGALIIYASRFLIKRRNKEFAIYLTLGMSKRKISRLLFFETLMIGVISLGVGLLLGIGASQLISVLIAKLFETNMDKFTFVFSEKAFFDTILYFGLIYLIVIFFNTVIVGRLKIIELLQGSKKSEKAFLKNPLLRAIVFIVSASVLGYAYWWVNNDKVSLMDRVYNLLWPVIAGVVATFLIFWSLSGLIMEIVTRSKKFYFKGLSSFVFRQISSKVNTAVVSMSLISLLLFLTISILSLCFSINESMKKELAYNTPVDAMAELTDYLAVYGSNSSVGYLSQMSNDQEKAALATSQDYMKKSLYQNLIDRNPDLAKDIKDHLELNVYADSKFTYGQILPSGVMTGTVEAFMSKTTVPMVRVSDYNKLAKLYHRDEIHLKDDQYQFLADFKTMAEILDKTLAGNTQIKYRNFTLNPVAKKHQEGFITSSGFKSNTGILVVPDNVITDQPIGTQALLMNYNLSSSHTAEQIDEDLRKAFELGDVSSVNAVSSSEETTQETKSSAKQDDRPSGVSINFYTKLLVKTGSAGMQAIATFVGFYLGIIFLISSAAILALKQLSESSDNTEKYAALRRLGASNKMLNRALFVQIAIFFLAPLLIGIIHSIFGIMFASSIIESFGSDGLLASIPMTVSMIVLIYGGYFLLTYISSKRIISEKQLRRD